MPTVRTYALWKIVSTLQSSSKHFEGGNWCSNLLLQNWYYVKSSSSVFDLCGEELQLYVGHCCLKKCWSNQHAWGSCHFRISKACRVQKWAWHRWRGCAQPEKPNNATLLSICHCWQGRSISMGGIDPVGKRRRKKKCCVCEEMQVIIIIAHVHQAQQEQAQPGISYLLD